MTSDTGATAIPDQAIIVLCLVGAGVLVLCGYAVTRHYYGEDEPREMNLESQVHDGQSQTQYMRMLRLRHQEDLQRTYAPGRSNHSSKYPLSSVNSVM